MPPAEQLRRRGGPAATRFRTARFHCPLHEPWLHWICAAAFVCPEASHPSSTFVRVRASSTDFHQISVCSSGRPASDVVCWNFMKHLQAAGRQRTSVCSSSLNAFKILGSGIRSTFVRPAADRRCLLELHETFAGCRPVTQQRLFMQLKCTQDPWSRSLDQASDQRLFIRPPSDVVCWSFMKHLLAAGR